MKRVLLLLLLILGIFGILDSAYLTYEHYANFIPPCSATFSFIDCGKVLKSQYSMVLGVPLALIGVMHYFLLSLSVFLALLSAKKIFRYFAVYFSWEGLVASLYFMFLQIVILKSICLYCTLSAFISFIIFLLSQWRLREEQKELIVYVFGFLYQKVIKNIFFLINPETVHELLTSTGELLGSCSFSKGVISYFIKNDSNNLSQKIAGIEFNNPVGLAAGFDYDVKLTQILPTLNFGFGTVGTITNLPYIGNPPPMLGRLPKSKSLMVNKGFKNMGVQKVIDKLKKYRFNIPIGISVGTRKSVKDLVEAFTTLEEGSLKNSYYELNISCPNLNVDLSFYPPKNLDNLLKELAKLKIKKPVFVKMPIEKSDKEVISMLDVIIKFKFIKGVIFGNLQKNKKDPSLDPQEVAKFDVGNFSGKPCEQRSNELIKLAYKRYGGKLVIIGCGGIFSAEDAYRKIKLGASLVQLITGMIYQGPLLITQINMELPSLLQKDGLSHLSQAIGKDI